MEKIKVEMFSKKELIYELKLRGIDEDESTVDNLRKKLREVIKLGVKVNYLNIKGMNLSEEIKEIEVVISELQEAATLLLEELSPSKLVRLECKVKHYKNRIVIVKNLDNKKEFLDSATKLSNAVKQIEESLKGINCSESDREKVVEYLNQSVEDEREFEERVSLGHSSVKENEPVTRCENESSVTSSMYCKLSNPIELYLKEFKMTDGLNVELLLNFLKVIISMIDETSLSVLEIMKLSLGYTKGVLRIKMLDAITNRRTFEELHRNLLECLVPITMRESLKGSRVMRNQRAEESLVDYVIDVRLQARLLLCPYTETEIVKMVCIGLNNKTRAHAALCKTPASYNDLELLAVECANVAYSHENRGWEKTVASPSNERNPREIRGNQFRRESSRINNYGSRVQNTIKCYNCGKVGHIARNCYAPKGSDNTKNSKVFENKQESKNL